VQSVTILRFNEIYHQVQKKETRATESYLPSLGHTERGASRRARMPPLIRESSSLCVLRACVGVCVCVRGGCG
jgi:hypothetical protein